MLGAAHGFGEGFIQRWALDRLCLIGEAIGGNGLLTCRRQVALCCIALLVNDDGWLAQVFDVAILRALHSDALALFAFDALRWTDHLAFNGSSLDALTIRLTALLTADVLSG